MTVCNYIRGQRGERILCYSIKAALLGQHFVHIVVQCLVRFPNPLADFFSSQAGTLSVQCLPLSPASFSPSTRTSRSKWRRTRLWLLVNKGSQLTCLPPCPFLTSSFSSSSSTSTRRSVNPFAAQSKLLCFESSRPPNCLSPSPQPGHNHQPCPPPLPLFFLLLLLPLLLPNKHLEESETFCCSIRAVLLSTADLWQEL